MQLFADRFLTDDGVGAIDVATGSRVQLVSSIAGGASEQAAWEGRCARFASLCHPRFATLLDFGLAGECRRFEAWRVDRWLGGDGAGETAADADGYLRANGWTTTSRGTSRVGVAGGRTVVVPDESAGREAAVVPSDDDVMDVVPGVVIGEDAALGPVVETIADLRQPAAFVLRCRDVEESRWHLAALARICRRQGFVPVRADLWRAHARLLEGRAVCLLCDGSSRDGWRVLASQSVLAPKPHVVVFAGAHDLTGAVAIPVRRCTDEELRASVTPARWADHHAAVVRRAIRRADGRRVQFARLLIAAVDPRDRLVDMAMPPRVAETAATYSVGRDEENEAVGTLAGRGATAGEDRQGVTSWRVPADLARLRQRLRSLAAHASRAGRASQERLFRQLIGALARRRDWTHAALGAAELARGFIRRGRAADARRLLAEATTYARESGRDDVVAHLTVLAGGAALDDLRLDEAESLLRAAVLSSAGLAEGEVHRTARLALARCLFWRGKFHEAAALLAEPAIGDDDVRAMVRGGMEASRVAIGTGDLVAGVRAATDALAFAADRAADLVSHAACALAFAHLSVGDYVAVEHDVVRAAAAARSVRDPLAGVRARLIGAEAARRRGRHCTARRLSLRLQRLRSLPPIVGARAALLADLIDAGDRSAVVQRHVRSTGLAALALFAPGAPHSSGTPADIVALLELCQRAEDEEPMLLGVCRALRASLGARATAFLVRAAHGWDTLAAEGGRVDGAFAARVEAVADVIAPHPADGAVHGGAPVKYGGRLIAVVIARWPPGVRHLPCQVGGLLATAAAAAAPACAALLARRSHALVEAASDIVGTSAAIGTVRQQIARAAAAPFPVLVEGESGAGKELVARAIHRASLRRDRAFCALNCAALPDELVESELFGHARGAFTGAAADRPGVFEAAHLGSVFLDEIGELSPRAQAKVLRTVQDGEIRRVGETVARHVDVRLIAATNRDLRREAAEGRFRADLLYRLDVIRIAVPPLRARPEDIAALAEHVWREASARVGSRAVLAASTIAALTRYDWPGNVRELQNVLFALAARSPRRGVVEPSALPAVFGERAPSPSWRLAAARRTFEMQFVSAALTRAGGHRGRAARELGLTRQGLAKLVARLGLESRPIDRDRTNETCCASSSDDCS